ncbi:hypothetical protein FRC11_005610, partial [Ceratobasidium sp. 423]
ALESSTNPNIPLKSAIGGLNQWGIDIYQMALRGRQGYQELWEDMDDRLRALDRLDNSLMGPAMTASVNNIGHRIIAKLKVAKVRLERDLREGRAETIEDSEDVLTHFWQIYEDVDRLVLNANVKMWKTTDEEITDELLRKLLLTRPGVYSSWSLDTDERCACAEGTRLMELQKLRNWAHNPSVGAMYWINGMAGTGKTAISYSLCAQLHSTGQLAASFFCTRMVRDYRLVLPAIAYQLAQFSYPFRYALSKVLECNPDTRAHELEVQFQNIIAGPLGEVRHTLPPDFVVVIDALDECSDIKSIAKILDLLITSTIRLPVRFLLSSRPEPEISRLMVNRIGDKPEAQLVLHELDPSDVRCDIKTYLGRELHGVPLTSQQMEGLVQRCDVLFIYASTACRYINGLNEVKGYEEAIDTVLGLSLESTGDMEKGLNELYASILEAAFKAQWISEADRKLMRIILDTVVCAEEPMTIQTLVGLLDLEGKTQVTTLLHPLFFVIHVMDKTGIITPLHASFPEFLLNLSRSAAYRSDVTVHHNTLTKACLRHVRSNPVHFNSINGPESLYLLDNEVANLARQQECAISSSLDYACRYWRVHLKLGSQSVDVLESMNGLYTTALQASFDRPGIKHEDGKRMKSVLDAVVCAQTTMTKDILVGLLGLEGAEQADLHAFLQPLHAVVRATEHTRIATTLHALFPDSTFNHVRLPTSHCDVTTHHDTLANACLRYLKLNVTHFTRIYDPESLFLLGSKIIDLAEEKACAVGSSLLYACRYWEVHLNLGGQPPDVLESLDEFYRAILSALFHRPELNDEDRKNLKSILDTVICAEELMTTETLAGLLALKDKNTTHALLQPLSAVLRVVEDTGIVEIRHASFLTFMLDRDRSTNFYCDATTHHNVLTKACLLRIKLNQVQFNICGLGTSYLPDDKVADLTERAAGVIPSSLLYACRHWAAHLEMVSDPAGVLEPMHDFLSARLLLWMEVLNIKKCVEASIDLMKRVEGWSRKVHIPQELTELVHDALQFVTVYANQPVSLSTPHIYISMLPFWPIGQPISSHYATRMAGMLERQDIPTNSAVPNPEGEAGQVTPLESPVDGNNGSSNGYTERLCVVRFSSDGSHIVTGGNDGSIHLWDIHTGELVKGPLTGHLNGIYYVDISPDNSYIASASSDQTIRLWEVTSGSATHQVLDDHIKQADSIRFTPDNALLACKLDNRYLRVWDVQSGQLLVDTSYEHLERAYLGGFSPGVQVNSTTEILSDIRSKFADGSQRLVNVIAWITGGTILVGF